MGTMVDDRTGLVAHHAATTLMTGLRLLPPLLAIRRGRLRRRARGLRWALHPQHHLILSLSKDRSAPRGSAAQDRFGPSYEGISETQPAQGGGNYPAETHPTTPFGTAALRHEQTSAPCLEADVPFATRLGRQGRHGRFLKAAIGLLPGISRSGWKTGSRPRETEPPI